MAFRLLVIEGEAAPADASVAAVLAHDDLYQCQSVRWGDATRQILSAKAHAVVPVAVPHTAQSTAMFEWLRSHPIPTPTVAVLGGDIEPPLLRSVCESVDDFVFSPLRPDELRQRLSRVLGTARRAVEVDAVREHLLEEMGMTQLVGTDPAFVAAVAHVPRFARSEMPILITGETGTGKELCARAIHHLSERRDLPFIAVDCGTIPDHLFENELFGHVRGAFTDAHRDQRGLVAMAEGGTLLLDEVDALSVAAQGKLLRFLQERCFRPLGSDRFVRANVNVVAATNRDLEEAVREKVFRADLFFRLNVLRLHLPPLRERPGDVSLLARHFVASVSGAVGARHKTLSAPALSKLGAHHWPGNVRELANVIQRAVIMSPTEWIAADHIALVERRTDSMPLAAMSAATFRGARAETVAAFERGYVAELLRRHNGNVTQAAREADKDRRAFGRLVKKYGIDRHNP